MEILVISILLIAYIFYQAHQSHKERISQNDALVRLAISKNVADYIQSQVKIKPMSEIKGDLTTAGLMGTPLDEVNPADVYQAFEEQINARKQPGEE